MYYQLFKHVLLGPGLKVVYRPWAKGLKNIPAKGPAILASNHLSFADSIFLPLVMKRKLVFLGKAEYFTGKGPKGFATRAFMSGVGTIPVHRGGGRASEAALRTGLQVLNNGELLGIYPEGTRSPDGRLYRGKTGVARIAIESGVAGPPRRDDRHEHRAAHRTQGAQPPPDRREDRQAPVLPRVPGAAGGPRGASRGDRHDHEGDPESSRVRSTSTVTRAR